MSRVAGYFKNEWHEVKDAGRELWHFVRHKDWRAVGKSSLKRKYWWYWIFGILLAVAVAFLGIYRDKIVTAFQPHRDQITSIPGSWLIPSALLIVVSFPPLGGGEVILLVVGMIWGWKIGFAICAAGIFIGETACFFAFTHWCTHRAKKAEHSSLPYACLARLLREGGVFIPIIVRYSVIPGHLVTAMMSTIGMSVWIYSIAIIVSMPKNLAVVYLGVIFGSKSRSQKNISLIVFGSAIVASIISVYIIYMRARKYYPELLREQNLKAEEEDQAQQHEIGGVGGARGGGDGGKETRLDVENGELRKNLPIPNQRARDPFAEYEARGGAAGMLAMPSSSSSSSLSSNSSIPSKGYLPHQEGAAGLNHVPNYAASASPSHVPLQHLEHHHYTGSYNDVGVSLYGVHHDAAGIGGGGGNGRGSAVYASVHPEFNDVGSSSHIPLTGGDGGVSGRGGGGKGEGYAT